MEIRSSETVKVLIDLARARAREVAEIEHSINEEQLDRINTDFSQIEGLESLSQWLDSSLRLALENKQNFKSQSPSLKTQVGHLLSIITTQKFQSEQDLYERVNDHDKQEFLKQSILEKFGLEDSEFNEPWDDAFLVKIEALIVAFLVEPFLDAYDQVAALPGDQKEALEVLESRIIGTYDSLFEAALKDRLFDADTVEQKLRYATLLGKLSSVSPEPGYIDALVQIWKFQVKNTPEIFSLEELFHSLNLIPSTSSQYLVDFASTELAKSIESNKSDNYKSEVLAVLAKVDSLKYDEKLVDSLLVIWNQANDSNNNDRTTILKILLSMEGLHESNSLPKVLNKVANTPVGSNRAMFNLRALLMREDSGDKLQEQEIEVDNLIENLDESVKTGSLNAKELEEKLRALDMIFAPLPILWEEYGLAQRPLLNSFDFSPRLIVERTMDSETRKAKAQSYTSILAELLKSEAANSKTIKNQLKNSLLRLNEFSLEPAFANLLNADEERNSKLKGIRVLKAFLDRTTGKNRLNSYLLRHANEIRGHQVNKSSSYLLTKKEQNFDLALYLVDKGLRLSA